MVDCNTNLGFALRSEGNFNIDYLLVEAPPCGFS